MIIELIYQKKNIGTRFVRALPVAVLTALAISFGMIGILSLFHFSINPAIPATIGVVGAAAYAAKIRRLK